MLHPVNGQTMMNMMVAEVKHHLDLDSTWMGDRLGTPGAVGFFVVIFSIFYRLGTLGAVGFSVVIFSIFCCVIYSSPLPIAG
jgi:hypothetical protein